MKEIWKKNVELLRSMAVPLVFMAVLYSVMIVFRPGLLYIYVIVSGLIITLTIGTTIYYKQKFSLWSLVKKLLASLLLLTIIVFVAKYLVVWYGVAGYLAFVILYAAYIIFWRSRKEYFGAVEMITKEIIKLRNKKAEVKK